MSLHRGRFVVVVLALSLAVIFSGCHKRGVTGVTSIQLTAPNGNCLQNGATGNVQFSAEGVCWTGPNSTTAVTVALPANCPFRNCSYPTSTGSMCTGTANSGAPGDTWTYTSITIGGNGCTVGNDGLIMK